MTMETVLFWAFAVIAAAVLDLWLLPRLWRNWERTGKLAAARARLASWQARWQSWGGRLAARAKASAAPASSRAQNGQRSLPAPTPVSVSPDIIQPAHSRAEPELIPENMPVIAAPPAEAPVSLGATPTSSAADIRLVTEISQAPPSETAPVPTTRIHVTFDLAPGARVRVTAEDLPGLAPAVSVVVDQADRAPALTPERARAAAAARRWPSIRVGAQNLVGAGERLGRSLVQRARAIPMSLELALFWGALGIYLLTRLIGLDRYPIYFFTDEAVHTVLASNFLRDGFKNTSGEFLPTFFSLGPSFNLNGVSVYLQVLPLLLFGKSVFVTRATSVFITLLGTAAVGLTLRDIFKVRYWWTAVLLLTITPAWFLHSRTAFEYAEVAAFYGAFIYFYLRYRCGSPRWLYGAVVTGALVFYTHGLGEVLILSTAALLFLIDLPYHLKNRAVVGRGAALALILALPYVRFSLGHGSEFIAELRQRGSYWAEPSLSLVARLSHFASEYIYGFSPLFWYFPETRDIVRHVMNGYGNILWPTLPFALLGLAQVFRKFRQAAYRVILVMLLTTPIASALVAIGVPRMLWFLMPITVITALGLSAVMEWLERRRWPAAALSLSLFAVLTGFSFYMLYDALTNGPLWSKDYTLYGMQYGAKQLFGDAIPAYLKRDPQVRFEVSPSWANGTDQFIPFFLSSSEQARVQLRNIDYYLANRQPIDPNAIQVMTRDECARALASPKIKRVTVEQVLLYPDGTPGFYFVRLAYSDNADAIFQAEREERQKPVVEQFELDGQMVTVSHSLLGSGQLQDVFDDDPFTLVRGLEANPLVFDLTFSQPRPVTELSADFGTMPNFTVSVSLYAPGSSDPVVFSQTYLDSPRDPHYDLPLPGAPPLVARMRIEVKDNTAGNNAQIHVRTLRIR